MDSSDVTVSVVFGVGMILFFVYAARRGEKMLAERAGRTENGVAVKVDAADPQVVYPDVPSVEYNWSAAMWQEKQGT